MKKETRKQNRKQNRQPRNITTKSQTGPRAHLKKNQYPSAE
jgi:hypothetical protein